MSKPNGTNLTYEVRYASDIAGRALFDTYTSEDRATAASLWLERNFRRHGLPSVAKTVTISIIGGGRANQG